MLLHIFSSFPTLPKPCILQATLHGGSVFRNALKSYRNAKNCEKCVKDASCDYITEITPKSPSQASQNRPKNAQKWRGNPKKSIKLQKNVFLLRQKKRTTKKREKKRKKPKKGCPRGGVWRLNAQLFAAVCFCSL